MSYFVSDVAINSSKPLSTSVGLYALVHVDYHRTTGQTQGILAALMFHSESLPYPPAWSSESPPNPNPQYTLMENEQGDYTTFSEYNVNVTVLE